MALSVLMQGSRKLPVINNAVLKLLSNNFKNSQSVFTPILAKNFSGLNRSILDSRKNNTNTLQVIQSRALSHSAIWSAEKIVSLALIGLIPGCLLVGGPICDNLLAVVTVLHMHWGVEAVVVDYIRPSLCGNTIPPIARGIVYILSIMTLVGLLTFNMNDMGLSKAIRRLWAIEASQEETSSSDKN